MSTLQNPLLPVSSLHFVTFYKISNDLLIINALVNPYLIRLLYALTLLTAASFLTPKPSHSLGV